MKFLKSIKKAMLVISVTYIAIGVILILNKEASNKLAMEILAYGLSIAGLLSMIRYFLINVKYRFKRDDFVVGALIIALAVIIYLSKNDISHLVEKIIAIAMIISGLYKIQDMFDTKATGKKCIGIYLFGFMVCFMFGLIVLLDAIKNVNVLYVFIGIGMCVCGISDIVSNFYVAFAIAEYENRLDKPEAEKEIVENIIEVNKEPEEEITKEEIVETVKEEIEEENEDVPLE